MRTLFDRIVGSSRGATHFGYDVKGQIVFVCEGMPNVQQMQNLRHEVLMAYRHAPWRHDPSTGMMLASEAAVDDGVTFATETPKEQGCRFVIVLTNGHNRMEKGQLYPYEKHLAELAGELANRRLLNVAYVKSIFEVSATTVHFPHSS